MTVGILIFIAVCVVALAALFSLRGNPVLKGDVSKPVAIVSVAAIVVVAVAILYKMSTPTPKFTEGGGGEGEMMTGGPGGGMGGPGGGMREPSPHRDLGRLVRKMAMLNNQEGHGFSAEQAAALLPILRDLQKSEAMTSQQAEASAKQLETLLTPEQAVALAAVELPRRARGGGMGAAAAGGEGTAGTAEGTTDVAPQQDWRAAMRARMLETAYVKKLYDQKAAEDPAFITDEEKQSEFFRGLRGQISPFLSGSAQEALEKLISDLSAGKKV